MSAHAKLSASGANTWLYCSASPRLCEGIPNETSEYAEEGTNAHAQAESMLLGKEQHPHPEMADDVLSYVELVDELASGHERHIEQRLEYTEWVPDGFGTADAVIIGDNTLTVIDLKFGKGVKVNAEDNPQLRLYALAALQRWQFEHDITHIRTVVCQPRLDHVSQEELTVMELLEWGEWVKGRAELALSGSATPTPGEKQCRWCRARFTCKARAISVLTASSSEHLTNDNLAMLYPIADEAVKWANDIKSIVTSKLESGETVPGYKLVEGRSQRKWADNAEAELLDVLPHEKVFESKLLGVTAIEKLLKKHLNSKKVVTEFMSTITTKPAGKPAIVKTSDPRPSVVDTVANFPEG